MPPTDRKGDDNDGAGRGRGSEEGEGGGVDESERLTMGAVPVGVVGAGADDGSLKSDEALSSRGQSGGKGAATPAAASSNTFAATEEQGGSADYTDFVRVRGMVSRKAAAYFSPRAFLRCDCWRVYFTMFYDVYSFFFLAVSEGDRQPLSGRGGRCRL